MYISVDHASLLLKNVLTSCETKSAPLTVNKLKQCAVTLRVYVSRS